MANIASAKSSVRLDTRWTVLTAEATLFPTTVVPAEAGTQESFWIPASAGMTRCGPYKSDKEFGILYEFAFKLITYGGNFFV